MTAADPNNQELRAELAGCYQAVGDLQGHSGLQNLGDPAAALASYRKGLAIYQAQVANNQNVKDTRRGLAVLQMRIGDLQMSHGDPKEGISEYRLALGIFEELFALDPTNAEARRLLALGYQKVGGAQEDTNPKEALASYAKATVINGALVKADPNNAQASMSLAISLRYAGDLESKLGDRAHALTHYEQVLQILDRLAAAEPKNVLL